MGAAQDASSFMTGQVVPVNGGELGYTDVGLT